MEGLQKVIRNASNDPRQCPSTAFSSFENPPPPSEGLSTALSSSENSRILIGRPARQVVSMFTCSKLCAICFAVGVVVGFTLKQRVRRWASRILKRMKDD
ncbi:hypothetical protein FNV43_RR18007 [Rhamnella rubrinervis]|uniref:Transmembrane protein n=1 Tax=Rhamnella rubrinervis TaxID=2594499 RepID=A0A8K0E5F2_9ROSA|nr:hypothetical protein FNV43_RR18007 [Rhamnella rubrinervis]